jgi:anti-sigma B factor antagonist
VPTTDFQVHDGLLAIHQAADGDRLRLALRGEMDLANAETADTVIREALASGKAVVIDLGKLEFIDSTGISVLVMVLQSGSGAELTFLPSEHQSVRRLLSLTGLDERMGLAPVEALSDVPETTSAPASPEPLQPAA